MCFAYKVPFLLSYARERLNKARVKEEMMYNQELTVGIFVGLSTTSASFLSILNEISQISASACLAIAVFLFKYPHLSTTTDVTLAKLKEVLVLFFISQAAAVP